jgi:hypothetical protein
VAVLLHFTVGVLNLRVKSGGESEVSPHFAQCSVFEIASSTARSGMCASIWFSRSIAVSGVPTARSRLTTGRPCFPRCRYACWPLTTAASRKWAFWSSALLTALTSPSAPSAHPPASAYAATAAGSAASDGNRSQNLSKLNDPLTNISPALIAVASSRMATTSNWRRLKPRWSLASSCTRLCHSRGKVLGVTPSIVKYSLCDVSFVNDLTSLNISP